MKQRFIIDYTVGICSFIFSFFKKNHRRENKVSLYRGASLLLFSILIPGGANAYVSITKSVNNTTPNVGDIIEFTIKVKNNDNWSEKIEFRDGFPVDSAGESYWGTTANAFEFVSVNKPNWVTCSIKNYNGPYLYCVSKNNVPAWGSFTTKVKVRVKKTGHICNMAHGYTYYWNWEDAAISCVDATQTMACDCNTLRDSKDLTVTDTHYDNAAHYNDPDWNVGPNATAMTRSYKFTVSEAGTVDITLSRIDQDQARFSVSTNGCPGTGGNLTHTQLTFNSAGTFYVCIYYINGSHSNIEHQLDVDFTPDRGQANNDSYTVTVDTVLQKDATEGLLSNDTGEGITVTDHTSPQHGTLQLNDDGSFTYTPDTGYVGQDSFTYTITDSGGHTSTATVTIDVIISYSSGSFLPFTLINPPQSRNIIGSYKIAGNTLLCLTEKTDGYGGTCQGNNDAYEDITSNMRVSKYLDIDDDPSTWNSTSSYVEIPDSFDPQGGVIWAGLFWQGRLSTDKDHPIHYAVENGSSGYRFIEIGEGSNAQLSQYDSPEEMAAAGAADLKLKVDDGDYQNVSAAVFHTYTCCGGTTYAAFANVTDQLKSAIRTPGKHIFTVANLTTMEGRENSPGAYGGWALVVIYGEDYNEGHARNISIYNGFISIGTHDPAIAISGFKLPSSGKVDAQLSVFSGEGEYRYGYRPGNNSVDWMKISNEEESGYQYMPGVPSGRQRPNRDNMFDAILYGIKRDHIVKNGQDTYNDQSVNNVGVDVDTYDVSDLMTQYREDDANINTVYIKTYSNNDYITPGMMAFTAQLYQPAVCYDYVVKRNGFIINSKGREYNTTARTNDEISFTIAIRSLEGDMDLRKTSVALTLDESAGHLRNIPNQAYYSEANSNTLIATPLADSSTSSRPVITIGKGRTPDEGGILSPNERYFTKFYYQVATTDASRIEGKFNIEVNATMNFGSGDFWQILQIGQCPQTNIYSPVWYRFNVERDFKGAVPSDPTTRYSLPTRIAGRDFNYSVASYNQDSNGEYTVPAAADGITVDVEMVNIGAFDDNQSYFKCSNPEPSIIMMPSRFVYFRNGATRITITDPSDLSNTYPVRNATFRMWFLTDENGTIITDGTYHSWDDDAYFTQVYNDYFKQYDTLNHCGNYCGGGQHYVSLRITKDSHAQGCYACLRDFFGQPFCARDNFAIRPSAYRVYFGDSNVSQQLYYAKNSDTTELNNQSNHDNQVALVAQYPYLLRVETVDDSDRLVSGYYTDGVFIGQSGILSIPPKSSTSLALTRFNGNTAQCTDQSSTAYDLTFHNGIAENNTTRFHNAGEYLFEIWDSVWTKVDHSYDNPYKTIFDPDCRNSSEPECNDCRIGNSSNTENEDEKIGCDIDSLVEDDTRFTEINITYIPDHFTLGFSLSRSPSNGSDWIYTSSNIDTAATPMALEVNGTISAMGAVDNTTPLSNFIEGCLSDDLNISLGMFSDKNISEIKGAYHLNPINAAYRVDDINGTNTTDITLSGVSDNNLSLSSIVYDSANFSASRPVRGTGALTIYFNFDHRFDDPVNPIKLTIEKLKAQAVNLAAYRSVDDGTFYPEGNQSFDQNFTFYYGRAKPSKYFYDDVTSSSIETPVSYQIFCDLLSDCAQYDINVSADSDQKTDQYDWYLNLDHNSTAGDGTIVLTADHSASVSPSAVVIDQGGVRDDLNVSLPTNVSRPVIVNVRLHNTSDPWLIFNKDGQNEIPDPFYRIHFIGGTGAWAGYGETGHVVESNASRIRTRRLEW